MQRTPLGQTLEAFVQTLDARLLDSAPPLDATIRPPVVVESRPPLAERALQLLEVIGEGGMGVVRLARQGGLDREVAVKMVREEFRQDADVVARLIRESRVTGLVEHPNVIPLHTLERGSDGMPQMVMKRIEGVAWRELIHDPQHPEMPRDAIDPLVWHVEVLMRVCDAVHYAHSRGILHLDIKPDNVMIGRFREVYLVDWGIAVSMHEAHRGAIPLASELKSAMGTPAYIAPELVRPDESTPDERTDVYLLAATLHEIVTRRPPHGGTTLPEVLYAAMISEIELPSSVPEELSAIVRRGLAREPDERYASAEALRRALADFLAHRSSMRLAEGALAELQAFDRTLSAGHADAELPRRLGECLFGFRAALREWPQNELARHGLARALLRMAEHHLDSGETSAAQALLAEVLDVPAEHAEKLDALRTRAIRDAEHKRALTDLGRQQDLSPGLRRRAIAFVSLMLVANISVVWAWELARGLSRDLKWHFALGAGAAFSLLSIVAAAYWRRHDTTEATRKLGRVLPLTVTSIFVSRVGYWLSGVSLEHAFMTDTFLLGISTALVGVMLDPRAYVCAAFLLLGWVMILIYPEYVVLWMIGGATLGVIAMGLLWFRSAPRE